MKSTFLFCILLAAFTISCTKNGTSIAPPIDLPDNEDTAAANLVFTGMFSGTPGESVQGSSDIYLNGDKYTLLLDKFSSSAGPDLHVYLSMGTVPNVFIDLGKLKANSGQQIYEIPGSPDFSEFNHVLIHCVQFNHTFGISELNK